jgi:Ca2+-transporting ATPase
MITGDHPATARSIAEALELVRPGEPVSSGDPQGIDVRVVSVYARVSPSGKTAIVNSLQEHGELVAMTGDGVNDAPALRASDIGVAMGRRGTEVAKAAADLILTGDDLSAMVPAIAEGRRAFDNLRRFLHYGLSGGLAEVLLMLVGPFVGFPLPLQAGQILWVNLLTHGMPGVAMGGEPAAPDVLSRPPRSPGESLVDGRTAKHVAVLGSAIAVLCLLAGAWAKASDRPWQSTIFLSLAFAQLAVAMALRPRNRGGERNLWLPIAVVVNVALAWLAVQWHPLEELLRTQPMHLHDLGPCLVVAAIAALIAFLQTHPMPRR